MVDGESSGLPTPECRPHARRRRLSLAGLVAAAALGAGLLVFGLTRTGTDVLLAQARDALAARDYRETERLALRVLGREPHSASALLLAGEAATRLDRPEEALALYARIPDDGSAESVAAHFGSAELLMHHGRACEAERHFRYVLRHDPDHVYANDHYAFLLNMEGRRWEAAPLLFALVRQNQFSVENLLLLGNVDAIVDYSDLIDGFLERNPDDPLPLLGRARTATVENRVAEAHELLSRILAAYPELAEAYVRQGQVVLETQTAEEFAAWQRGLFPAALEHPDAWFVLGSWYRNEAEDARVAARCFWEAVRRDPNHRMANYQLSQALIALGERELADPFLRRAEHLEELASVLSPIYTDGPNPDLMLRAAELTEALGRPWEAWGWYRALVHFEPGNVAAARERDRLRALLDAEAPPRTLAAANPAYQVSLAHYPAPGETVVARGPTDSPSAARAPGPAAVRFANVASAAAIDFRYYNGDDPETPGMVIFQDLGGGIAVLDYDGDGWSDLHLTQGADWPRDPRQTQYLDRLYRNLGDGTFQDVTQRAGLGDNSYSHGAAVGDFNGDGFPDVYVANIGANRLYRNNGDGTFSDVTLASGTAGSQWSTSCAIADFNGDGHPDIYVTNYLTGNDPFTRVCRDSGGPPRVCPPTLFTAEQDRLYLSLGDGRFEDVTESAGIVAPNGKGLGVVAADFDGSGRLSLFVANDTTANFYFLNQTPERGARPAFLERGLACGLAFDREGRGQACMGIGVADADGNGLLDLFVSNFYNESNTLYLQQPGNIFIDRTRQAGLRDPSFAMLGFGTQFLDADLDGLPDIVLANGHVDDFTHRGAPYQMPPQFFLNVGDGGFVELPQSQLGDYFAGLYLGRGLAKLDFNRDGLEDFVVSHLDAPVALVLNQTQGAGHFLAVELRGTVSARDAIGATLRLRAGDHTWTAQLTAGDGYLASNERMLIFGLGPRDRVDELVVRWPSGLQASFHDLPADRHFLLIEGRGQPVPR